jgi:ABC-type sugar transport system ATPase subunit
MVMLRMSGITKRFPGVQALERVDFALERGEVHVLLGENGAGKSTLVKILAGALRPDEGTIHLDGSEVAIHTPRDGHALGIRIVYQDAHLIPRLTVAENVLLGRLPRLTRRLPLVDWRGAARRTQAVFDDLHISIDPWARITDLSAAQRQLVEIARALSEQARILIMDEPTSALSAHEIESLFAIIRRLKAKGVGVIYISHRLEELAQIADRVTILRDGRCVATLRMAEASLDGLVRAMVGRELTEMYPRRETRPGEELLSVTGLGLRGAFTDVSLSLRRGEIVGITGLVGSGIEALAHTLFGAIQPDAGHIRIHGTQAAIPSPGAAISRHIGLVPEDRKEMGLVLKMAVQANVTLASLPLLCRRGWLPPREEERKSRSLIQHLAIVTPSGRTQVEALSGGNQQKVVLAKWLCRASDLLLAIEPTRGVDVGAKAEIYRLLSEMVAEGAGVLLFSSDLAEVLGLSDRVLVMRHGRMVGEIPRGQASREQILARALVGEGRQGEAA